LKQTKLELNVSDGLDGIKEVDDDEDLYEMSEEESLDLPDDYYCLSDDDTQNLEVGVEG
jgi:hypothetical protein